MPKPIDAGTDTYPSSPDRETTPAPDDYQAAALIPDHSDRPTIDRERRDDAALAKTPAGRERLRTVRETAPAEARTLRQLGVHAVGAPAAETTEAEVDIDSRPHTAQRMGGAALNEAAHEPGDDTTARELAAAAGHEKAPAEGDTEGDDAAAGEAGGGNHDGHDRPRGSGLDDDDHQEDDHTQRREHEPHEPGTVTTSQLRAMLDNIATYGARVTDEAAPPQVDLQALQQRLDAVSAKGADTLRLDPAEVVELVHLEPRPSQLDKLAHFDNSETSRQPVADRILTERALSLLPITRREILVRANPMGGSQDTATIANRMGKTEGSVQQQRWHAQQEFTRLADRLQRGEIDLKEYGIEHPKSRSPLTLLARLDVPIPPDARLDQLRETARASLRRTPLNDTQRNIMSHLYGLFPGQHAVSTANITALTGYRGTSINNIERVMFGLQSTNYHPERAERRQARDER